MCISYRSKIIYFFLRPPFEIIITSGKKVEKIYLWYLSNLKSNQHQINIDFTLAETFVWNNIFCVQILWRSFMTSYIFFVRFWCKFMDNRWGFVVLWELKLHFKTFKQKWKFLFCSFVIDCSYLFLLSFGYIGKSYCYLLALY